MGAAGSSAAAIDPAAIAKSLNDGTISALLNVAGLYRGSPPPSYAALTFRAFFFVVCCAVLKRQLASRI
jgi:hypothetical protein